MKKKLLILLLIQCSACPLLAINLNQYVEQIIDGRNQLIDAIKSLKAGKVEISKIYSDQLKPQLIDTLDAKIKDTNDIIGGLKNALGPLTDIPNIVKTFVAIGDLEPTLKWIIDNPLSKVTGILNDSKNAFQPITEKLIPPSQEDMDANQKRINDIYAQADALEKPEEQAAKRKEADEIVAQLARQKQAGALYAKFDISIAKLQSAVCKLEKTLKAVKAKNFTPSPECAVQ